MPPKKARFENRGGGKGGKGKGGGKGGRYNDRNYCDYDRGYIITDRVPTGGMTDTMTGVATATPETMVDQVTTDGALAPMAHPRPIQGTAIVLSHR